MKADLNGNTLYETEVKYIMGFQLALLWPTTSRSPAKECYVAASVVARFPPVRLHGHLTCPGNHFASRGKIHSRMNLGLGMLNKLGCCDVDGNVQALRAVVRSEIEKRAIVWCTVVTGL